MFDFNENRKESAKRRHPKGSVQTVPAGEYDFLKWLHAMVASGKCIVIGGPTVNEQMRFEHAKMLKDHYGLDEYQVLDATGFWVLEKEDGETNQG